MSEIIKNWDQLLDHVTRVYGIDASLVSILFLIGIHESGFGFRTTTREQKTDLISLAQCILLSREHFYIQVPDPGADGLVWIKNPSLPFPSDTVLEPLLQTLILEYFNEKRL